MRNDARSDERLLCSDLVTIHWENEDGKPRSTVANLEDISRWGACLTLDSPLEMGTALRVDCSSCELRGKVRHCRFQEEVGYIAGIELEPDSEWSRDQYEPKHLLDPSTLPPVAKKSPCCAQGLCRRARIARVMEPQLSLREHVVKVARRVARLCGGMDESAARACFAKLLNMEASCELFQQFYAAYLQERRYVERQGPRSVCLVKHLEKLAELLDGIPQESLR